MTTDEARNLFNNSIGDPFAPIHTFEKDATPADRIAYAAEFSAHYLQKISQQLAVLLRDRELPD